MGTIDFDNRSLPAMFFAQATRRADKPFLWHKREGRYRPLSWRDTAQAVRHLALGLIALGLAPGDRVALIAENRPEWVIADLAIMSVGAVTVPAYTSSGVEDYRHLFADSGAVAAIVSKPPLAGRVLAAANQIASMQTVIAIEEAAGQASSVDLHSWSAVMARGAESGDAIAERVATLKPDDTACLIYTSGTGGTPKGVMTTHRNILANCRGAFRVLEILGLGEEVFLSFLPLSHSYEHTAGLMFPISIGAQIYFAEGAETLAANMPEARPTIMTAVPRLYEVLHQRVRHAVARESRWKRQLFEQAVTIGQKRIAGERLNARERALDPLLDRLVRAKVRRRFGGRLKAMISGGAPLNPDIGLFFLALGVTLLQGYGQTEAAPVIACNPPGRVKIDTVGPPFDGVAVRLGEDGELLVRGDNVMKGYWNDPEGTARALAGGWLHTGDVGLIDADGYIRITERKRDFIKNSGGEMIAPARVEGYLTLEPEIAQAMVSGDRRPYLVAVIVPDPELAAAGADPQKAVAAAVARVNRALSPVERVRRFVIATEPFAIANGQLTPTLKIRRHVIRETYGAALDRLYDGKSAAA